MNQFICKLCSRIFSEAEIQDAIQLSKNRSGMLVRFKDGSLHDVRRLNRAMHERWHVRFGINNYPGCLFCRQEQVTTDDTEQADPQSNPQTKAAIVEESPARNPDVPTSAGDASEVHSEAKTESSEPASAQLAWVFRNILGANNG